MSLTIVFLPSGYWGMKGLKLLTQKEVLKMQKRKHRRVDGSKRFDLFCFVIYFKKISD